MVLEVNDSKLLTQILQYMTLPGEESSKKIIRTVLNITQLC